MSNGQNDNYKISVIVPVYNVEDYLREALENLIIQSIGLENIEVIMIDDCSTDNSGTIMDSFSKKYDNFTSIHLLQNTGGASHPRNVGIKQAKGSYIMFLDADDKYTPDTCKIMLEAITKYDSDLVYAGHNYFNNDYEGYFKLVDEIIINTSLLETPALINFPPAVWSKIYRREMLLLNDISFPDCVIGEDSVFVLKCLLNTKKVTVIPVSIYKYRLRNSIDNPSMTQIISDKFFREYSYSRKLMVAMAEQHKYDYLEQRFHKDIDYAFWMLNKSNQITKEEEIASILEDLYWFVEKGEEYLSNCRISDSIIIKKILKKDFTGASKAFLFFSEFRELERVIVEQQKEIEVLKT